MDILIFPFKEFISQKKQNKKPKEFVLKNKIKQVVYQPNENTNKRRLDILMKYNNGKEKDFLGYQIFGVIDLKIYGVLEGPLNTIYENGFFPFIIEYSPETDYWFDPPKKFYFLTKIFHPNIDESGLVSVDILQYNWHPCLSYFSKITYSIQSLLDDPNPDIFVNEYAAKLYKENIDLYQKTVREWTSKYANFETVQKELKKLNFQMEK